MKTLSTLSRLVVAGLLTLSIGCNISDNGVGPENEDVEELAELAKEATASYEYSSLDAAGVAPEDKDAIFSVGWSKFYNPIEEGIKERSDAFSVAPDSTFASGNGFRPRFGGKDMGKVTLDYGDGFIELFKVELRNGGVFYNFGKRRPGNPRGMLHEENGEVSEAIPFIPGQTYRFDATGSESFPALSIEITAPGEALTITGPAAGTEVDGTSELEVTWQGGDASQPLMIGLVPLLDRSSFQQNQNGGPSGGPGGPGHGFGGKFSGPDGPGKGGPGKHPHLHFRYIVEENNGSFTIPAEDIEELLSFDGVQGVLLQVKQMVTSEIVDGDAQYAIQLRSGDAVQLTVPQ